MPRLWTPTESSPLRTHFGRHIVDRYVIIASSNLSTWVWTSFGAFGAGVDKGSIRVRVSHPALTHAIFSFQRLDSSHDRCPHIIPVGSRTDQPQRTTLSLGLGSPPKLTRKGKFQPRRNLRQHPILNFLHNPITRIHTKELRGQPQCRLPSSLRRTRR